MAFDFPNAPTVGQTFQGYIWDGEKWTSNATLSPPPTDTQGRIAIRSLASGTFYLSTYGYIDRRGKDQ